MVQWLALLHGNKQAAGVMPSVCVCVQDFADQMDAMPSITMENNVIHNNEGYGVILVKPSSGEEPSIPVSRSEGGSGGTVRRLR